MEKLFPTQDIGSLPKAPWMLSWLRGRQIEQTEFEHLDKWSKVIGVDGEAQARSLLSQPRTAESEAQLRNFASLFGLRYLESAGLDYVYDGEANRIEMYEHAIRNSAGFEFYGQVRSFDDRYYRKAAAVGKVGFKKPYHLNEFRYVKDHARASIKTPVTGPYTLAEWSFNEYYPKRLAGKYADLGKIKTEAKRDLILDIAKDMLRPNLQLLVEAGAEWIQIDEPALTTKPTEVPLFVEAYNECVAGLPCKFSVHICFSDYKLLYPHILGLKNCKQLALEFANRDDDHRKAYDELQLLNQFSDTREIGLGVVDVHVDTLESPELVRDRILYASKVLGDPKRIYVNPDCGLRTRSWDVAYSKLNNIVKGAALARQAIV